MAWYNLLNRRVYDSASGNSSHVDEVNEELMFHLRSLLDENLAAGMSFDAAWTAAQQRFGSLERYAQECRRVPFFQRLGFQVLPIVATTLLGILVVWLVVEVRSMRAERDLAMQAAAQRVEQLAKLVAATTQSVQLSEPSESAARIDLAGQVVDRQGRPIEDANVLVILKTWPSGRYLQEDFATKTDAEGYFRFPSLVHSVGQHAVQIAIIKDGYTIASSYQLKKDGEQPPIDPVKFELLDAPHITLALHDRDGKPWANTRVRPVGRTTTDGIQHAVYFQGSEPIEITADAEGKVDVACFARGDKAVIYVAVPGREWTECHFRVPEDGETLNLQVRDEVAELQKELQRDAAEDGKARVLVPHVQNSTHPRVIPLLARLGGSLGTPAATLAASSVVLCSAAAEDEDPTADIADVPALDLRAGGDEQKKYFLIGKTAAADAAGAGQRLLLVLPGGDGSADFQPFVRRMYKYALNDKWLIAELVAPTWDEQQKNQIVWPTTRSPYRGAKFTTEQFIDAVIAEVKTKAKIDARRVFLLGWSSGGPACYAAAIRKDAPIAGAMVAMSIFKPQQLSPLVEAKGKPFYLLQSPDDQVTAIRFAQEAEQKLRDAGAKVKLEQYQGGHGWRGDVFGMLRAGTEWLDSSVGEK